MRARHLIVAALLMLVAFPTDLTAAAQDSEESFLFVVLGHVRGNYDGLMNPLLDELLTKARKLDPDMVFLTGDMIYGYIGRSSVDAEVVTRDWDRLDAKLAQLGIPIYRVPGNHDIMYSVTRDIYFARYGEPPQAVSYGRSLFLLLNSSAVPEGDDPAPLKYARGKPLDSRQIDFIREKLLEDEPYDHVFLFMHHLLWWSEDAPWWRDVHPLLVGRNVRAVFGGDFGPMKFSHMRRDGIDYVQSGIENYYGLDSSLSLEALRTSEGDRLLAQQFDNFLYVAVDGPQVTIEVKTVGETSSGKFSPQRFRDVHQAEPGVETPQAETSLVEHIWDIIGTPRRLVALALVMGGCFLGGVTTGAIWNRRSAFHRRISSSHQRD